MDCYDYLILRWRELQKEQEGCLLIFMHEVFTAYRPGYCIWDKPAIRGALHMIKLQDAAYFDEMISYVPLGWKNEYNDKIIKVLNYHRTNNLSIYSAYVKIWAGIVGTHIVTNYDDVRRFDFISAAASYLDEFILMRENLIGCSRLPQDLFGKE